MKYVMTEAVVQEGMALLDQEDTVYVAHDTEHAWMELNGKVYDTLFARAKDYEKYGLSYKNYSCWAVDKRKI